MALEVIIVASTNMCIRTDSELKRKAEDVLSQLGLTMSGTINVFLQQIVREQAVPVNLSLKATSGKSGILSISEISVPVKKLLKKYNAEHALLFGSYARGDANPRSDIDLIIYGGSEFDITDVYSISEELHCVLNKQVDIYEISEIKPDTDFYHTIMKEGLMIA